MSDTPPGNPQSRGDKRRPTRPGAQSASFLTHLSEARGVDSQVAEKAAVAVLTGLLRQFEPGDDADAPDPLALKLLELLPVSRPLVQVQASAEPEVPSDTLLPDVARAVGQDADAVEPLVRAVFQGLREYLTEAEAQELERLLSWDLQHLWRRTQ
ncbi:DUF2267 domain-containing protein [Archangium primigenium]|uniref:DUF2267 domain-containing protein n=1 Tax=[Archangium] primigenium TaxID=2792470 RepID=UPI0019566894|nr:DUF2267 domain-containing protein [Archangium primigenium]MBM7112919.1 DUF2267 domain-containing protein [Archangium primigenium]